MEEVKASYLEFVSCKELFPKTINEIVNSEFKHHVYSKCKPQIQVENYFLKIEKEQLN